MKNYNPRKIVYLASLLLFPAISIADVDIKLNCKLRISIRDSSGTEINTRNVVVEIYQNSRLLTIIPNDVDFAAVGSNTRSNTVSVLDQSNTNMWSLENTRYSSAGHKVTTSIKIDRNTGVLTYFSDFNEGRVLATANGNCEKIDTTKKKF